MSNLLEKARNIINEKELFPESTEMKKLVKGLKGGFEFGLARKILAKAHNENSDDVWIIQQLALCTYKDDELLPAARFNAACPLVSCFCVITNTAGSDTNKPHIIRGNKKNAIAFFRRIWVQ